MGLEWIFLFVIVGLYLATCSMSYNDAFRQSNYYLPSTILIGLLCSIIWNCMVKYLNDKNKIYFYSLVWDVCSIFIYYAFPLIFLNVKIHKFGIVGVALIIIGLVIVKMNTVD